MSAPRGRLQLAAVVGLARFLDAHGREQPELAGLRRFMAAIGAAARLGIESGDERAIVDIEMALQLASLLLREGMDEKQRRQLDENGVKMLAALLQAAGQARRAPDRAIQA